VFIWEPKNMWIYFLEEMEQKNKNKRNKVLFIEEEKIWGTIFWNKWNKNK
jgi:hypothetical protein